MKKERVQVDKKFFDKRAKQYGHTFIHFTAVKPIAGVGGKKMDGVALLKDVLNILILNFLKGKGSVYFHMQNKFIHFEAVQDGVEMEETDALSDGNLIVSFLSIDQPTAIGTILTDPWIRIQDEKANGITSYLLKGQYEIVKFLDDEFDRHNVVLKALKGAE